MPSLFCLANCTCPSWRYWCKHLAALGLTYVQEPDAFEIVEDSQGLRKKLQQKKKNELVEMLMQAITQHPNLRKILLN